MTKCDKETTHMPWGDPPKVPRRKHDPCSVRQLGAIVLSKCMVWERKEDRMVRVLWTEADLKS